MAKVSELRELGDAQLEARRAEASEELFNLRFQLVTGQLENVARISVLRREIARVRTLQREREIAVGAAKGVGGKESK